MIESPIMGLEEELAKEWQLDKPEEETGETNITTTTEIDLTRHGKKEKQVRGDEDFYIHLTPLGKVQAINKAIELGKLEIPLTKGSPRARSRETAGLTAFGHEIMEEIGASEEDIKTMMGKLLNKEELDAREQAMVNAISSISEEDLEKKYQVMLEADDEDLKWIEIDSRLDFDADNGPVAPIANKIFNEGQIMSWLLNDSDKAIIDNHDQYTYCYSRLAGNVADLLLGYYETAGELNQTVSQEKETYEQIKKGNEYKFQRIFGTHATVSESFIMKALEASKGREAVEELIAAAPNGFKEAEGMKFVVENDGKTTRAKMVLPERLNLSCGNEIEIDGETIRQIAKEGEELEKAVRSSAEV